MTLFHVRWAKRNRGFHREGFDEEDAKLNFREGHFKKVLEYTRESAQR